MIFCKEVLELIFLQACIRKFKDGFWRPKPVLNLLAFKSGSASFAKWSQKHWKLQVEV